MGIDVPTTAVEIARRFQRGELLATDVVRRYLEQAQALNPRWNAFVEVWADEAWARAQQLDQRRAKGQTLGPLAGVPIGIKDNLCVNGHVCSCGSRMLATYRPTYTATTCQRLLDADAILLGRTNMDEFAMGSSTEYSIYGPTINPTPAVDGAGDPQAWSPGGSSGGSAAAVAAGMVPVALGSDTGGSIRQPAAFCGIYGLKPTYGRLSRYGLVAFASSLDQVGPMAQTPADLELMFRVLQGPDQRDATCLDSERVKQEAARAPLKSGANLRIGLIREHVEAELEPSVRWALERTIQQLQDLGATIQSVSLPCQRHAIATYYLVASCEAASNLSRYDGMHFGHREIPPGESSSLEEVIAASRGAGFGREVKRRILLGTYALSHGYADRYYQQACRMRRAIQQDFSDAFGHVDLLLGPTTAAPAFPIGAHDQDPVSMYLTDQFTVSANLAGLPAISIPVRRAGDGLVGRPVAVQFHAPPCGEARLLEVARCLHDPLPAASGEVSP
jgi:aspartyl-tRNA(Asn)/glutamyl-tRNA(Gln) amidotransferase subunit A